MVKGGILTGGQEGGVLFRRFSRGVVSLGVLFIFSAMPVFAQVSRPQIDVSAEVKNMPSSANEKFGRNKEIPVLYENEILFALSHFPTLEKTKIKFKIKKGSHGLWTRPAWGTIFRSGSHRTYRVFIGEMMRNSDKLVASAGINGQVGVFGHEISHVFDFSRRTGFGMMGVGIGHLSNRYLDRLENKTDSLSIVHGFGYQMIAWSKFKFPDQPDTGKESPSKKERYLSVGSIRRVMNKTPGYSAEN
jgi:hypothetical protein